MQAWEMQGLLNKFKMPHQLTYAFAFLVRQKKSRFYQQALTLLYNLRLEPARLGGSSPHRGFPHHRWERIPNQTNKIKMSPIKPKRSYRLLPCFDVILKNPNNNWANARQWIDEGWLKLFINFQKTSSLLNKLKIPSSKREIPSY